MSTYAKMPVLPRVVASEHPDSAGVIKDFYFMAHFQAAADLERYADWEPEGLQGFFSPLMM